MKRETATFYISMTFLVLLAYIIQLHTFVSPDVEYLLYASKQLFTGGKYGIEVFETNPPMILYVYFPVILLTKLTTISVLTAMRIYILLLIVISISICNILLKKLITPQDQILRYFLFYTLMIVMLFLPMFSFAQREHILVILMLPYLLSAACTLENKSIHPLLAVLMGLMAGIGFALKPFFLVTPCLIELAMMIKQRRLFAWVRIEPLVIISVLLIYLGSIFLFQPGYIHIVLPLVMRYYFSGMAMPWDKMIVFVNAQFCVAVLLGYSIYYKQDCYRSLGLMLALALLGMIIAFVIPQTPWFYHVLPAFDLSLLLVAHFMGQTVCSMMQTSSNQRVLRWDSVIVIVGLALILMVPGHYQYKMMRYVSQFQKKHPLEAIANYMNQQSGPHSVACFSLGTMDCFPLVYDTHSVYGERYSLFWWYLGLRLLEKNNPSEAVEAQMVKDKTYLMNSFAEDLEKYQVRWVVVDTLHFKTYETNQFDILDYFSGNKKFRTVWQHYHYIKTFDSNKLYERTA